MNSQKIYPHPTISGALLFVSPLGNITVTNECMFKTTAVPAQGVEPLPWGVDEVIIVDNAKINSVNILPQSACEIVAMFTQEKVEDQDQ
jgi:hypothetical protein